MCEVLKVSKSGYYKWRQAPHSERKAKNRSLLAFMLDRAHKEDGKPGYRKLHRYAVNQGYACNEKRVWQLLSEAGYRSVVARRRLSVRSERPARPNLLNRQFNVSAPNRVWVSDITQIRCQEGWLYVAVVLDLYSRSVVGWHASRINNSSLVQHALEKAWCQRQPDGRNLLFHSDQGAQYRSEQIMSWLTNKKVAISMSRKGNCWDNACAESFFALMKKEHVHPLGEITRDEMKSELGHYIDEYYMTMRLHSHLNYMPPAIFEQMATA